jgi:hypothetical protein
MLGDVEVDDTPAVMGEHDEDEEDTPADVGTVKKSIETKSRTRLSSNVRQVWEGSGRRFGIGRETVRAATSRPS